MIGELTSLSFALRDFVEPLRRRLSSPEGFESLLRRYGWATLLEQSVFERVRQVSALTVPLDAFIAAADELRARVDAEPPPSNESLAEDVAAVIDKAATLVEALAAFGTTSFAGLPPPLSDPGIWESLAEHILDDLIEEYVRIHHPNLFVLLRVGRVVRYDPVEPTGPFRVPYVRTSVAWDQALAIARDPTGAVARAYHWGDPNEPFDYREALAALAAAMTAIGVPTKPMTPSVRRNLPAPADPGISVAEDEPALRIILLRSASLVDQVVYSAGVDLFPASTGALTAPSGLLARLRLQGAAEQSIPLGGTSLRWSIGANASDSVGVVLFPDGAVFVGGEAQLGARLELSEVRPPDNPRYLLGGPSTARIELSGISIALAFEGTVADPELTLRAATVGNDGKQGGKVVIPLDEADEFVIDAVDTASITFPFSAEIFWSSRTGLRINGRPSLDITVPMRIDLGPVELTDATVTIGPGPDRDGVPTLELRAGVGVRGDIGPVTFVIERIGVAMVVARRTRGQVISGDSRSGTTFGNLDVSFGFAPPTAIGLVIDAGVVAGGGFIRYDPSNGRYSGVLQLQAGEIGITGLALLDTQLPDGDSGYSLMIVMRATFPAIQIGFGFALTSVGGLVAVNRRVAVDQLRARFATGTIGRILAPSDPIRDAPSLLADLDAVFPESRGVVVVGPTAQLVWAEFVHFDIGVFIELPGPSRIVLLGSARAAIESDGRAYLVIRVDIIGEVDLQRKTAAFDAVLVGSQLLEILDLTGGAAFRMSWGAEPYVVLTLGGFHPSYNPAPLVFPSSLGRIAMTYGTSEGGLALRFEGYFAVTSNTLQFGARVEAIIRSGDFNIQGILAFDALIQFEPFHFQIDMRASVRVRYKSRNLAGLTLTGAISGPGPIVLRAKVCIELMFFDICFSDTFTIGSGTPPPISVVTSALDAMVAELDRPATLSASENVDRSVSLRPAPPRAAGGPVVSPLGALVWTQRRAPLGLLLQRVGGTPLGAPQRVDATGPGGSTAELDWFAPGSFAELTDDQALNRCSFERLAGGLRIGGAGVTDGPGQQRTLSIRQIRLPNKVRTLKTPFQFPAWLVDAAASRQGAPRDPGPAAGLVAVTQESWTIVDTLTGTAEAGLSSAQAHQLAALAPVTTRRVAITVHDQIAELVF